MDKVYTIYIVMFNNYPDKLYTSEESAKLYILKEISKSKFKWKWVERWKAWVANTGAALGGYGMYQYEIIEKDVYSGEATGA